MSRKFLIVTVLILAGVSGCSDNDPLGPGAGVGGAALLGLSDNHTLEYNQIDSITTYVINIDGHAIRTVTVIPTVETISIIKEDDNWIIRDGTDPILNLKDTGPYVLNNGYYRNDELIYFQVPAIVMTNTIIKNDTWTSAFEQFTSVSDSSSFPFYFTYFGYQFSKTYVETEEVLVPSGAYDALRFEVDLYPDGTDTISSAHVTEYYAPDIGLVRLRFEDAGFVRTLTLRDSY